MSAITLPIGLAARRYLSAKAAAAAIPGMTTAKLAQLRFSGGGPRYFKPTPKTVVYSEDDLIEWLESTARTGTAEAG